MTNNAQKGSRGVVVTLKSKMAATDGGATSGRSSKLLDLELDPKSNKSPEPLLDGLATSEHMSALLQDKLQILKEIATAKKTLEKYNYRWSVLH